MAERSGDYEWRIEGEEAEGLLYGPDESVLSYPRLRSGIEAATRLPGVEGPVYAAASPHGGGWSVSSSSHVAPGLVSAPRAGVLLVASSPVEKLGLTPDGLSRLLERRLAEIPIPALDDAAVYAACESGGRWAAEEGFIEEEDLDLLGSPVVWGEPDALGGRAVSAGGREWNPRGGDPVRAMVVGEVFDSEAAEETGVYKGALVFSASVGSSELGRIALEGHRQRILSRDFGDSERLVAAPAGTGEAADLTAAVGAATNYAIARLSLLVYALRRAMREVAGGLIPAAQWIIGGIEECDGAMVHRNALARLGPGEPLVCGDALACGTGAMLQSAPPFSPGAGDRWPWEEAGTLKRITRLRPPGDLGE
ncbi:RtcB family protein [Rubrobacter aplysinae]|uniref:RtcB family protein n=1 Tax=Rubrobacter aplysinae TaxID=909625 RepID=UPI00064C06B8|nr:RtcB family protein [Rubrobacter aplysinae]